MHPGDAAPGVWWLTDDQGENQLYYSPAGDQVALSRSVDFVNSDSLWFDPKTGGTRAARLKEGPAIAKPSPEAWLLLIQRKR